MKTLTLKVQLLSSAMLFFSLSAIAQTNVFDDIIAPSPNHTYLEAALQQENLVSALQDPNATLTVFAPDDAAFTALATALNTDINGLLALPNLTDILTYHVLGMNVASANINNGDIVNALSTSNTIKLTKTMSGMVYANQAMVTTADVTAANGTVHILNGVLLPVQTVVDVAIDNGFTYLATAVTQQELLPVLTNPLATFTVFAPTNTAFDNLAADLNTDINGILANAGLTDILTYHVLDTEVVSTDLSNGMVPTVNGQSISVDLTNGVMINDAKVTTADVSADNGVVHVIDKVLLPQASSVAQIIATPLSIYPNPVINEINFSEKAGTFRIMTVNGMVFNQGVINSNRLDVSNLPKGMYFMEIITNEGIFQSNFIKE